MIVLDPGFEALLAPGERTVDGLMALDGKIYRAQEGRRTIRIERGGRGFFLKQHFGVGWPEIVKNLLALRLPVLGAGTEWRALRHLEAVGIAAPRAVGFASRGGDPSNRQSVVVMEELAGMVSLEDLVADWQMRPPGPVEKRALIAEVAELARSTHDSGLNHRDLYLCHILRDDETRRLHLLDLHRAQIRRHVPRRWRIKDLSALLFSSGEVGLTRRDLLRFVAVYRGRPWRAVLDEEHGFWQSVVRKAASISRHDARLRQRTVTASPSVDGA